MGVKVNHGVHGYVPEYILEQMASENNPIELQQAARTSLANMTSANEEAELWDNPSFVAAVQTYENLYKNDVAHFLLDKVEQTLVDTFGEVVRKILRKIFPDCDRHPIEREGQADVFIYSSENTWLSRKEFVTDSNRELKSQDPSIRSIHNNSNEFLKILSEAWGIDSLDNNGMDLYQTAHFGESFANAYWNGVEMVYGEGDGYVYEDFAQDETVIFHELTHGLSSNLHYFGGLAYFGESGALEESFADVVAMSVTQMMNGQMADDEDATWLQGDKIFIDYNGQQMASRSFKNEKAYTDHPYLKGVLNENGDDPQPKHYDDKYNGSMDRGGVHINSGIANHAFYLAATEIGGYAMETSAKIWLHAFAKASEYCTFKEFAYNTVEAAANLADRDDQIEEVDIYYVINAWLEVGVLSEASAELMISDYGLEEYAYVLDPMVA